MEKKDLFIVTLHNDVSDLYIGESLDEVLHEMWWDHYDELVDMEDMRFTVADMVRGTEKECKYIDTCFHYCFAKGRIDAESLLEACEVA